MAKAKQEIAKAEETSLYQEERPDFLPAQTAVGRGQENVGVDDLSIPRISIVQDLSPQKKPNDPAYIEGAEPGMIFNSVTGKLYGNEILFVPCFYRKEWIIWKQQEAGGGFFGAFPSKEEAEAEMKKEGYDTETFKDKNGNRVPSYEIVDTSQQFGMIIDPASTPGNLIADDAVISMAKSKQKPSRQLNTMINMAGGDRFSRMYKINAAYENGKKGDYWNFNIRPLGFVSEEIYKRGEKYYEAVSAGVRDVNRDYKDEGGNSTEAASSKEY